MSLSRQLILIVTALIILGFVGTFLITVNNMRSYLATQLESHAQDAATSLGLSIRPYLAKNDLGMINTMVNAMFDSGYYREISIKKPGGETLVERVNPMTIEGVPQWFINLIPLDTPMRQALVSSGWAPEATVDVRSHPGYAYIQLWNDAKDTLWWFASGLIIAWVLLVIMLRIVLSPLKRVESQAMAIAGREFPVLEKLPWTRELRRVVIAMNKMSKKVERIVAEQTDLAEKMRVEAYVDPVTGLGNRRSFDMQLEHLVTAKEEVATGALGMIMVHDFAGYNDRFGYAEGDRLLGEVADLLRGKSLKFQNAFLARIGGAEFAILIPNATREEAAGLGERLSYGLGELKMDGLEHGAGHVGVGFYSEGMSAADLLSRTDMALRRAQQKGPNAWHLFEEELEEAEVMGARQWKEVIDSVIAARSVTFLYQPVMSLRDTSTLHYEALARIQGKEGDLVPAAVFMPMVERLGLTAAVDRLLVEKLMAHIGRKAGAGEVYSINLFSGSVSDRDFVRWLIDILKKKPGDAKRVIFEVSEYGALADLDAFKHLLEQLRGIGAALTLDNFGSSSTSFGYLRGLKLEFIKIDGSYIKDLADNKDNQLFVQAITEIAHGLDIHVIAKSVETEKDLATLRDLHLDGAQGYFTGKPQEAPGS